MISHNSTEQMPQPLEECSDLPDCCEEATYRRNLLQECTGYKGEESGQGPRQL